MKGIVAHRSTLWMDYDSGDEILLIHKGWLIWDG